LYQKDGLKTTKFKKTPGTRYPQGFWDPCHHPIRQEEFSSTAERIFFLNLHNRGAKGLSVEIFALGLMRASQAFQIFQAGLFIFPQIHENDNLAIRISAKDSFLGHGL
jgi:hypothetical protein